MSRSDLAGCLALTLAIACRAPGTPSAGPGDAHDVDLPGVDTTDLTTQERSEWGRLVSSLPAPCPSLAQSIAECTQKGLDCPACRLSAKLLARHLQRGKSAAQAEAACDARFGEAPIRSVNLGSSPTRGPANAPVTVVVWADFQCPFCARAAQLLSELERSMSPRLRVVFKHYPLPAHARAMWLAKASVAAQRQGRFWELHDKLFSQWLPADDDALVRWATDAGLDGSRFKQDLTAPATQQRIDQDRAEGEALGLTGTPFVLVNGRRVDAKWFDLEEDLDDWIVEELELGASHRREQ